MFGTHYRKRAEKAEAQLAQAVAALEAMHARMNERCVLININRDGRRIFFTFSHNGEIHRIGALGTWDDDVDEWKRRLLGE